MIAIIILNWNGYKDTIECIKSLYKTENTPFIVVIADNGSTDNSVSETLKFLSTNNIKHYIISEGESIKGSLMHQDVVLYSLKQNYGFAKGNNLALKLVADQKVDYFWILNNDTEVKSQSLRLLYQFMNNHNDYIACTPLIRYYYDKNKIWNCGGKLFWGFRKYYYPDQSNIYFNKEFFDISFITGCALLVRPSALSNNSLFTERFFFGEEDFELSMRWKQEHKKIACLTSSIIYHKVSASTKEHDTLPKTFIHYLNRYINVKQHFSTVNYKLWKSVNNVWIALLLFRQKHSVRDIIHFLSRLNSESKIKEGVEYDYFIKILKGGIG